MVSLHCDNNISVRLVDEFRGLGYQAACAADLKLESATDAAPMRIAAERGCLIVTHDKDDFIPLHLAWSDWRGAWGLTPHHQGVLVIGGSYSVRRHHEVAAAIDQALKAGWVPFSTIWYFNLANGWKTINASGA